MFGLQCVKLELQCVNLIDLGLKPVDLVCVYVLTWDANISNVNDITIVKLGRKSVKVGF